MISDTVQNKILYFSTSTVNDTLLGCTTAEKCERHPKVNHTNYGHQKLANKI